ncbi:MAG: hypothetical protein OEY23_14175 [Acidimicrobiia bacterium]|nr:hypothetical protein [Acidimicrobiia bacterium]
MAAGLAGVIAGPLALTTTAGASLPVPADPSTHDLWTAGELGGFVPITPARVLDTRPTTAMGERETRNTPVSSVSSVPANAQSIVVNVTLLNASGPTYVTLWGDGPLPGTSNLNVALDPERPFDAQKISNVVTTRLDASGNLNVYNHDGTVDVLVDVIGYYLRVDQVVNMTTGQPLPEAPKVMGRVPMRHGTEPVSRRLIDTRPGLIGDFEGNRVANPAVPSTDRAIPLGPGETTTVRVFDPAVTGGVDIDAVVLSLTATNATEDSFLTIWEGGAMPVASNLNPVPNKTIANQVIVPVAADGTIKLHNHAGNVDVVIDQIDRFSYGFSGYYLPFSTPFRAYDTRDTSTKMSFGDFTKELNTLDIYTEAAVVNVTITEPDDSSLLRLWMWNVAPADEPGFETPVHSNLNWRPDETRSVQVIVPLHSTFETVGDVDQLLSATLGVRQHSGNVHVVFDVVGVFVDLPGPSLEAV